MARKPTKVLRNDAIWKLSVQFIFSPAEERGQSVGNLLINHRNRWACANLVLPLTRYPQFVQDMLKMEQLDEMTLRELLVFFTGLNKTDTP